MTHNDKVLALLSDGKPHTHHEIYGLFVVGHSRISDLRKRGHVIEMWRDGDDYIYQLQGSVESEEVTPSRASALSPQPAAGAEQVALSDSAEQLSLVDVWRDVLGPEEAAILVYLNDPDRDNYSRKVEAA